MSRSPAAGPRQLRPVVIAQLVSVAGSQVSVLALPAIAVLVLHASPLAVSLLFAVSYAAQAASAPFAGVLADSVRSLRRLLVCADALQALIIISVPASRVLGVLSLPFLFGAAAVSGSMSAVTGVAIRAVAARSVTPAEALSGNSAITGARTAGQVAGPAIAGWLIGVLGAVMAVAVDAASYLASALIFLRLTVAAGPRTDSHAGATAGAGGRSLRAGFAALLGTPTLVRIAIAGAALNLGGAAIGALYVLYAFRILGLRPAGLGVVLVIQNGAAILAVTTANRVSGWIGLERVVPVFAPAAATALFLIPAASWLPPLAALAGYAVLFGYCTTVWTISSATMQQILVPASQIGRVTALSGSIGLIVVPVGAVTGGLLAEAWGVEPTLLLAASIALAGALTVVARPAAWRKAAGERLCRPG